MMNAKYTSMWLQGIDSYLHTRVATVRACARLAFAGISDKPTPGTT